METETKRHPDSMRSLLTKYRKEEPVSFYSLSVAIIFSVWGSTGVFNISRPVAQPPIEYRKFEPQRAALYQSANVSVSSSKAHLVYDESNGLQVVLANDDYSIVAKPDKIPGSLLTRENPVSKLRVSLPFYRFKKTLQDSPGKQITVTVRGTLEGKLLRAHDMFVNNEYFSFLLFDSK